ncbi:unnamed protein product [Echinostoma caproni]|uniref:ZZ-type domain-containing protein n=1 Tax=Echinostoma caproni TaxID=27848 RepID=A0A3P8FNQ0_9TREM|nr:unnamed protein product [Echinostoma caproni]
MKLIGHSQPIEGPHTDPFDRTINVPQIVDCLLQLYNRANAAHGQSVMDGTGPHLRVGLDEFDPQSGFDDPLNPGYSPRKTPPNSRCSTLPAGAKPPEIRDYDEPRGRGSITKCGRGFRRSASAQRASRRATPTGSGRPVTASNLVGSALNESNRSASLPESVQLAAAASGAPPTSTSRVSGRHGSHKLKRGYPTGPTKYPVNVCVDLTLNWLLNVYDRMRKGNIRAISFKVALTILSVANLDDKYRYLFSLIADSNGCVTEQRLSALLYECILIPRNLGEGGWIGKEDFTTTVKLCFSQASAIRPREIARSSDRHQNSSPYRSQSIPVRHFLTWLRFGPQTIMWLPLLHRVLLAEQMVHPVRCGVCQSHPIVGLRYRCLRCLNFDLCQQCFFSGRTARSHKLTHPMQEYCSNSTSSDSFRDFTRIVRNRFRSRDRLQQENSNQAALGRPTLQLSGSSRSRGRCCEPTVFSEDKPRPAPKFGSDLASLLPRDTTSETSSGRGELYKGSALESPEPSFVHAPTSNIMEPVISRPTSTQLHSTTENHPLPRAASDTRQITYAYGDMNATAEPYRGEETGLSTMHPGRGSAPIADDEHHLIAKYSRELRQQSEPELTPRQVMHTAHAPTIPSLMDRSTISDGFPSFGNQPGGEQQTGHLSLDRRQLGRTMVSQSVPYSGSSTGHYDPNATYGRFTGLDSMPPPQMEPQFGYRPTPQPIGYPMASNPSIPREQTYDPYGANNIQRSYSLRARSQPPPDAHWQSLRQTPNAQMEMRSQLYPTHVTSSQTGYPQSAIQTIRTLEEERRALLTEYDRLRQRGLTPATPYSNTSRMQTQQAQQRFARMQLQHQLMQQQELLRANLSRGYNQRMPLQRPPSAGPAYPSATSVPGRFTYGGSLGRANSVANGFSYLGDMYGSEPRVGGASYGPDGVGLASTEFQAVPMAAPGDVAATEARLLREHKGRLEVRMQQLEDHNRQLEQQLQRLRQYLVGGAPGATPSGALGVGGNTKASAELLLDPKMLRQGKSLTGSGSVGQLANASRPDVKTTVVGTDSSYRQNVDPAQSSSAVTSRLNQHEYYQPNSEDLISGTAISQPPAPSQQHTFPGINRADLNRYN